MGKNAIKKIKLNNGLRVLFVPQPSSLAATVLILVKAGSEYESKEKNGISHFLEHMVFKGTVNRPNSGMIAEELAALGAESNAFTAQEYTGYWAKVENKKLPKILEIVSDLYLNPIFNPKEIDKERGVVIEEINMYEDTPMRRVQELFVSLLYGDQPAGWDVGGRKEVIRALSREDFLEYRSEHYLPGRTIVVVAGNFREDAALKQIKKYFIGLKAGTGDVKKKTEESQKKPNLLVKFKKLDQSHLVLGVRGFNIFDKRRYALQVLADILGGGMSSRLFKKVREELGAAYYVRAETDFFLDHGYLAASCGTDHKKIQKVIEVILEEFNRLRKEIVPEKELQRAKDHMVGSFTLSLETSDELAGYYGMQEILTESFLPPEKLIARIKAVRAEDIFGVAQAVFSRGRLNLAVIGPYKKDKIFRDILKL